MNTNAPILHTLFKYENLVEHSQYLKIAFGCHLACHESSLEGHPTRNDVVKHLW